MKRIINVQNKWYNLLGMYDGKCYLGDVNDIHNEVVKSGIIWEMQPFYYQNEVWYGKLLFKWFNFKRNRKKKFLKFLKSTKLSLTTH